MIMVAGYAKATIMVAGYAKATIMVVGYANSGHQVGKDATKSGCRSARRSKPQPFGMSLLNFPNGCGLLPMSTGRRFPGGATGGYLPIVS